MLAIFDNDGTLCDSQAAEIVCYTRAVEAVTGRTLTADDWAAFHEPTSAAMARHLLEGDEAAAAKEEAIKREFLRLLEAERVHCPGDFTPIPGAVEFLARVREEVCPVAIATGCFDATARFKLACCGIALEAYPHATSSDAPRRRDIIPMAAARAGHELASVVYFGDAPWDVRVTGLLGIPMIGIGRRYEHLRELGVPHTFRDYSEPDRILEVLVTLGRQRMNGTRREAGAARAEIGPDRA